MAQEHKKQDEAAEALDAEGHEHEQADASTAAGDLHPEALEAEAGDGSEQEDGDDPALLKAEIAELKDRHLRALAELENLRKRADRDRRDAELYGITRFARDLLSVHDNFERAMKAATDDARAAAGPLIEGIELTQRELIAAFGRHKINKVSPARGERFDPRLHQAMFEAPVPGTSAGDIIEVMGEGFTIGERLLRPAQVGVSSGGPAVKKPQEPEADAAEPAEAERRDE